MGVHVVTTVFSSSYERNKEVEFAQMQNSKNQIIDCIHVISEDPSVGSWLSHPKIHIEYVRSRPTFRTLVDYSNTIGNNKIVCIANSDIYFNHTLSQVRFDDHELAYCLTRWIPNYSPNVNEYSFDPQHGAYATNDSWILKTPIFGLCNISFYLGLPGCDSRFVNELYRGKKKIINPSKIISSFHVHNSGARSYSGTDRLKGYYSGVISTDSLEYNESNIRHGYSDGDDTGIWFQYFEWIKGISHEEFWSREDLPLSVLYMYPDHTYSKTRRQIPHNPDNIRNIWRRKYS